MDVVFIEADRGFPPTVATDVRDATACSVFVRTASLDTAVIALGERAAATNLLVFVCQSEFGEADLARLAKLCHMQPGQIRVVVVGAIRDTEQVLSVIRCGAADFLDYRHDFRNALDELLRRLTSQDRRQTGSGLSIGVTSPVGGAGTSVLACNLAAAFAKKSSSCGLIDLRLRGGILAALLNITPRHSLASIAGRAAELDATMFSQMLIAHESGVQLLAAADAVVEGRVPLGEVTHRLLGLAREKFPAVVFEFGDPESGDEAQTLAAFDRVVVVLRPDYVSLIRGKQYLERLARCKIGNERLTIVVNRVGQQRELPYDCMVKTLGVAKVHTVVNDPAAVFSAYNLGIPFVTESPDAPVSRDVRRLCDHLRGESESQHDEHASSWRDRCRLGWGRLRMRRLQERVSSEPSKVSR